MTAFVVFTRESTQDQAELDRYMEAVTPTFDGHDVEYLAAYGPFEVLEGSAIEGAVIPRFPSLDDAKRWYFSPACQEVVQHRFKGASYRGFIVEGL